MKQNKKGVSPVISTVLLILIVVILAAIIFLWARGFIKEAVLKEIAGTEKTADKFCSEISIEPVINSANFGFKNIGNVPIYKFELKLVDKNSGDSEIYTPGTENQNVNPGFMTTIQKVYSDYEEIRVIPILLGKGENGGVKEFRCPESDSILI